MVTTMEAPQRLTADEWEATVDVALVNLQAIANAQADLLATLMTKYGEVMQSLAALTATADGGPTERTLVLVQRNELPYRTRINQTQSKEGWKASETTLEVSSACMPTAADLVSLDIEFKQAIDRMVALRNAPPAADEGDPS